MPAFESSPGNPSHGPAGPGQATRKWDFVQTPTSPSWPPPSAGGEWQRDQGPRARTVPQQGQDVLRTHGVAGHGQPGSTVCGWAGLDEEKTISVVTVCFSEVALCGRRHEGDRRTGEGPETGALLVPPSTPGVPGSGGSTGVGSAGWRSRGYPKPPLTARQEEKRRAGYFWCAKAAGPAVETA